MTAAEQVRLLINDTNLSNQVFTTDEIDTFLALEGGSVKRAAAQALDTIADDEALTSKVITTQDLSTNGAQVAAQLRARAVELRRQASSGAGTDQGVPSPRGCFPPAPQRLEWADYPRGSYDGRY